MEGVKGNHVLVVANPSQGHVNPMMKLCRQIAKHGLKVTFVNTQSVHDKLVAAAADQICGIQLASMPDALVDDNDPIKLLENLRKIMPQSVKDLIQRINNFNPPDDKIRSVIADISVGWILDTAEEMGAQTFLFSPNSAAFCTLVFHIPKLLQHGLLHSNGNVDEKCEKIVLSDDIPCWGKDEFPWSFPHDPKSQKSFFQLLINGPKNINRDNLVLINTCYELEPSSCDLTYKSLPIGPLLEMNNCSNFYSEDESCLTWLDTKPLGSVIYVSFGSLVVFSQQQLEELALGLELSGRAFLWVVRSDLINGSRAEYPDGFLERVGGTGKIVEWAPQEKVLSHPSVKCFLSHCGWNSTLEGVSKGVLFLCWPSFGDQFHNRNYICDKWGTGLRIDPDGSGIRSRNEIKEKIDMMFGNDSLKANTMRLKEICAKTMCKGGSSYNNFERFVDHLKK